MTRLLDGALEIEQVVFDEETIKARVKALAAQIEEDYRGESVIMIGRSLSSPSAASCPLLFLLTRPSSLPLAPARQISASSSIPITASLLGRPLHPRSSEKP